MNIANRLWRFVTPTKHVVNEGSVERDIEALFRECFSTPSGEAVLKHLIEVFKLDAQVGCLPSDHAVYEHGKRDALKYILAQLQQGE